MKRILLLVGTVFSILGSNAQTNYTTTYTVNGGNPLGLNTDNDDITAGWTTIVGASLNANQWSSAVPMPFTFNYFGNPITQFRASANGLVTFSIASTLLPNDNDNLPSSTLPDSTIACFWDAFSSAPPTGTNDFVVYKVWGTAPNRQLWIKWVSFEMGAPSVSAVTFSCVLEESSDKIYMVESFAGGTPLQTLTTGLQLNSTRAVQDGNKYKPQTLNTSSTLTTDNDFYTFTPYLQTSMAYLSSDASQPITTNISRNSINEGILRIQINTSGELSPISVSQFALNTTGTTTLANITNARLFYTGKDSAFNTAVPFGTTITSPAASFNISGSQTLASGANYFWLTYSISGSATAGNAVDAGCTQITINSIPQIPTTTAPTGNRLVSDGLSGTYTVGIGGNYTYLSDALKDVNTKRLSGDVVFSIISDIDDTAAVSVSYTNPSAYKIKVQPSADVLRNITCRLTTPYIELNGTRSVTIDGKGPVSGAGKYLRFANKDTGSTFSFINGARFDTIQNAIIEGLSNSLTRGIINLGTSVNMPTGVQNIVINNNNIRDLSDSIGIPAILIYSSGSAALPNNSITISNNNLFNFRRSGVFVNTIGNGGNWIVSGNHFYYNTSVALANGDVVPIMMIPGNAAENNQIVNNYIGGQAPFCGGSAWLSSNAVNWVAMNINTGIEVGTSVQGNTIQNINMTATGTLDFVGIRIESGRVVAGNVTGNVIGHPSTLNSISNTARLTMGIYGFTSTLGEVIIANNTIANITGLGTTTAAGVRGISIQAGAAVPNIYNNTIYNLSSTATNTSALTTTVMGIGLNSGSEATPVIVRNNKIFNISALATAANTVPTGIVVDNSSTNGLIEGNTVYNITNISTGATASITGIQIGGGVINWTFRNNTVAINNGTNTNAVTIRGISDGAAANNLRFINNTVYVGGTAASGTVNTAAYERRNTSTLLLRNNILYNERTGGTGFHAALSQTSAVTNWTAQSSNYNLLVAQSLSAITAWGTTPAPYTFAGWQAISSGNDLNSWSDIVSNIPATSFFKNVANGDLSIDSTNALCWYSNGKGIAITGNTSDINGQNRSSAITTGAVDLGADEFTPRNTTLPPLATVSGNIAATDSSTFTVAGRVVAKIYWNSGTLPSAITMQYMSGLDPHHALIGRNYFNSYYFFNTTGGTGYNADVKLFYDSALFKTVPNAASIIMAGTSSTLWNNYPSTIVDVNEKSFRANGLTTLSSFAGTDVANPLPTELISFTANTNNEKDVNVYWSTVTEKNTSYFDIEVSSNGKEFETTGTVKANGNSQVAIKYAFVDENAFEKNSDNKLYYRLKMVDENGVYDYSKIVAVNRETTRQSAVELYPNPYDPSTKLFITATNEQKGMLEVVTLNGTSVSNQHISLQKGLNTLSADFVSTLPPGMYFVKVTIGNEAYNLKLIK